MSKARVLAPTAFRTDSNRWLLLMVQLPVSGSNRRVKVWRRLQQIGALPIRNGVYALPNTARGHEDFQWLKPEVEAVGGQASIFSASAVEGVSDEDIVAQFQEARSADYAALLKDIRATERRLGRKSPDDDGVRTVRQLRERAARVFAIDFFDARGRDEVEKGVAKLEDRIRREPSPISHAGVAPLDPASYHGRTWLTRPRPGVDRFASAWLVVTFIDPSATFAFGTAPAERPDLVTFDMFGGEFAHVGDRCTFEVLTARFGIKDSVVRRIGEIVHDLDFNDGRYRPSEAPGVAAMVEGLRVKMHDDATLLHAGITLFDAIYRGLRTTRQAPRRVQSIPRKTAGGKS